MLSLMAMADRRCGIVPGLVQLLFRDKALASRGATSHHADKRVFELFRALLSATFAAVYVWISTIHAACSRGKSVLITVLSFLPLR